MVEEEKLVGKIAIFNGYESLADDEDEILEAESMIKIESYKGDSSYSVVDLEGNRDALYESEFTIDDSLVFKKAKKKAVKPKAEAKPKEDTKKPAKKTRAKKDAVPKKEPEKTVAKETKKKEPAKKRVGNKNKFTEQEVDTSDLVPVTQYLPKDILELEDVEGEPSSLVAKVSAVEVVEEKEAEQIVSVMQQLGARAEELYFHIGGLLKYIKEKHIHFTLGFEDTSEGFSNFVDASGVCSRHMGKKWIYIYERAKHFSLNMEDLRGIGWAKARLVLTNATEQTVSTLLSKARKMSFLDLNAFIHGVSNEDEEGDNKDNKAKQINKLKELDFFKFGLDEDRAETIKLIMENNSHLTNGNDEELFYMAMMALDSAQGGSVATLDDHITLLEKTYDVKITIEKIENKDVIDVEVKAAKKKPKAKRTGKKVDIQKKETKDSVIMTAEKGKEVKKKAESNQEDGLDVLFE